MKNLVDSEVHVLIAAGAAINHDRRRRCADAIIVNTCGFQGGG